MTEEQTDLEGVVENEHNYAVHVMGDVCCVRHAVNNVGSGEGRTESRVPRFRRERGRGCKVVVACLCLVEDQPAVYGVSIERREER